MWRGDQDHSQDNAGLFIVQPYPCPIALSSPQLRDSIYASENEKARLSQGGVTNDVIDSAVTSFVLQSIVQHGPAADRLCNKAESDTLIDHQTVRAPYDRLFPCREANPNMTLSYMEASPMP